MGELTTLVTSIMVLIIFFGSYNLHNIETFKKNSIGRVSALNTLINFPNFSENDYENLKIICPTSTIYCSEDKFFEIKRLNIIYEYK
jgi:hypothetical protein